MTQTRPPAFRLVTTPAMSSASWYRLRLPRAREDRPAATRTPSPSQIPQLRALPFVQYFIPPPRRAPAATRVVPFSTIRPTSHAGSHAPGDVELDPDSPRRNGDDMVLRSLPQTPCWRTAPFRSTPQHFRPADMIRMPSDAPTYTFPSRPPSHRPRRCRRRTYGLPTVHPGAFPRAPGRPLFTTYKYFSRERTRSPRVVRRIRSVFPSFQRYKACGA